MSRLSIIVPVYWNSDTLMLLYEDMREKILHKLGDYEIVFVDYGSGDNSWEIMNLLEEINARGTTVVVVTHNLEIVRIMKKRVIAIEQGVVVNDVGAENTQWEDAVSDKAQDIYLSGDKEAGGFFDED